MELERCGDGGIALLELVFCRRGGKGVGMEVERCGDCGVACSAAAEACELVAQEPRPVVIAADGADAAVTAAAEAKRTQDRATRLRRQGRAEDADARAPRLEKVGRRRHHLRQLRRLRRGDRGSGLVLAHKIANSWASRRHERGVSTVPTAA